MSNMKYDKFVRKPFIVDAVEVTLDNIEEIATLVGELREENGRPFIQVNRNVVPGVIRVRPGYMMTRMGDNIRCYNRRVFANQFCENTPEIENWVNYIRENGTQSEETKVGLYGRIAEQEEMPQPEPETKVEVVVNAGDS